MKLKRILCLLISFAMISSLIVTMPVYANEVNVEAGFYEYAANVVNETFDAGTETWKNYLTMGSYSVDWNKNNADGCLQVGTDYNQIATVDSYSDYIVEFDYKPNYGSASNCRMLFKIGGYEFHMIGMAEGVQSAQGVTLGATITKENDYVFPNKTWSTFRIKKTGKEFWFYAKTAGINDDYTLVYKGSFNENKTVPFEFNVYNTSSYSALAYMDNLKIWDLSFNATIEYKTYDVNPGVVVAEFNKPLASTLPETVIVSDGTNNIQCPITKVDNMSVAVAIPDGVLNYATEYTIDFSNIEAADRTTARNAMFRTVDDIGILIVDETFDYGTETWKNYLAMSSYSVDWNKNNADGYLQVGASYNRIATVESYSDYVVEFDYKPNYGSATNCVMIFKIGGYEFHMIGMGEGVQSAQGVTSGATITKENDYVFPNQTWSTFRIKKTGKEFWFYAKTAGKSNDYTLVYKGTFNENKTVPFEFDVRNTSGYSSMAYMDNLKIWDLSFNATIKKIYDVNPGTVVAEFNKSLASTLPETVIVSDGTNNIQCPITKVDNKSVAVVIPDGVLDYATEYTIDFSNIEAADGTTAKITTFKTMDYIGELVVDETFDVGTETWKSLLTMSNYSVDWNKNNADGHLQVGASYNQVAMVDSYSDYVVEFDYKPNYGSSPNCRMLFKIGGYEFHMIGMAEGVQSAQGVTSGATITKENDYIFPNQTWSTFRIKKNGKEFWFYAKTAGKSNDYTLVYKGTFNENKTVPFEFNVYNTSSYSALAYMDNLKMWTTDVTAEPVSYFLDDFENGLQKWTVENNSVYCHDGVLENSRIGSGTISDITMNAPYDNMPQNPLINVRFSLNSGDWMRFILPTADGITADILLRKNVGFYNYTTGEEVFLKEALFDTDVMYDMNFECKDDKIAIYYKKASDTSYIKVGEIARSYSGAPLFRICAYNMKFKIEKVELSRYDINDFAIKDCPVFVSVGKIVEPEIINATEQNIVLSISDTNIAVIDGNAVRGVKRGTTILTAKSADGSCSCSVPVVCTQPIESITLSQSKITIEEGEVINLSASLAPATIDDNTLVWESSDESVASLFGISIKEKTVKAENAGCAVIKVMAPLSGVVGECSVTVIPSEEKGTSSVIFTENGKKVSINPLLFGMHRAPEKSNAYTNELYNDLGVKSLRAFLSTSSVTVEDNLDSSNKNDIPQVVALTEFPTKTVSELVEIVKDVKANAKANDTIYVEMGNETYDGSMNSSSYISKCKEFYSAVKAYDSSIKIGVVLTAQDLVDDNHSWNSSIAKDKSFYDAIIIHNYSAFYDYENLTRKDMVDSAYAWNRFIDNSLYVISEQFSGKEIWITEYGFLQLNIFNGVDSNRNEVNRAQTGKSVGAALTNIEKLFDMAESGLVTISNYHFDNDAQGFGVIQGNVKLPNYYAFKKAGELLNTYTNIFKMDAVKNENNNSAYRIKNNPESSYVVLPSADCWGFGNNSLEKVIISNRTDEPMKFSLSDYKLKKEWSYGGEDAFDDYLLWEGDYLDIPSVVPMPQTFENEGFVNVIEIAPYSMSVCQVSKDTGILTAAFNIADGSEGVRTDKQIIVTLSRSISQDLNNYLNLTANGNEVGYTLSQIGNNKYEIVPSGGLRKNTRYQLTLQIIEGMNSSEEVSFTTYNPYLEDCFTKEVSIRNLNTDNYEITFKAPSGETDFTVRNIPIYIHDGIVYYNNGNLTGNNSLNPNEKLRVLGHYGFAAKNAYFKIVVYGTEISIYAKASDNANYEYVGTIYNVDHTSATPSFDWLLSLSGNIKAKINPNSMTAVEFLKTEDGKTFYSNTMLPGENTVKINANRDACIIYGQYGLQGDLINATVLNGLNEYLFTSYNDGLQKKVFVWNNVNKMTPLQDAVIVN